MAYSQSPLCLLDATSSRALSYVSVWCSMSWESSSWTIDLSQVCCLAGEVNVGMYTIITIITIINKILFLLLLLLLILLLLLLLLLLFSF